ncbi:hypothetical protein MMC19_005492 [Ptychographa xylographoides]|nr:hypothetical protein [Ptychographa xylographoides]
MDHLPLARSVEHESSQLQDSIASAQQDVRLVRSEHGSPGPRAMPSYEQLNGHFSPLDPTSYPAFNNFSSAPMDEYNSTQISNPYDSYLATPEDQPPFSAGASMPPVDWSAFDLPVDNGTLGPAYSQPPSYASFDHSNVGQPGLTTSSSSENEEYIQQGLPSPGISGVNHYSPASPEQTGGDSYRVTNGTSFLNMPPASILTNNAADGMSFGAFLQGGTASPSDLEEFNNSPPADPEAFTHHGLTVQDAQKMAHPGVPTEAMNDLRLPATRDDNNDPLWAASFDDAEEGFDALEEAPGVVWRS